MKPSVNNCVTILITMKTKFETPPKFAIKLESIDMNVGIYQHILDSSKIETH